MLENTPFILSPFSTKTGKARWVEFFPQEQDSIHLSFPLEISTPTTMLSFRAQPEAGVTIYSHLLRILQIWERLITTSNKDKLQAASEVSLLESW